MSRLIEFPLDSTGHGSVFVEADDTVPPQGNVRVSVGGAVAEKASDAQTIMKQLADVAAEASEVSVEFGIKLTANAGVIIASTSVEGNCKVAIKWSLKA
jgi:hypothetical protein